MSSTVSHESRVMLAELLVAEKDATRVWLRAEMDGLVDSMFNRLTNKLMMNSHLGRYQSGDGGDCAQVGNHNDRLERSQLGQASYVIAQPSPSSHLMPPHQNVHYSYQQPNDNSNLQSQLSSLVQPTITPNAQVKFYELSNEQSNQNFDDDAGECYCDECLGAIEIDDEVDGDDDSDSVQCIEDEQEQEESSRPVKIPRMDSSQPNNATQPEVARQSPPQATAEPQPNQVAKRFITVHLQCTQSGCPDTFPEDQLNQHMFNVHLISPNRCVAKDCTRSFDNQRILCKHIKQTHPHTTQWHCDKCVKVFATYKSLSTHTTLYHQLGHFQCSYHQCTFTGEYKMKMHSHYTQQHKPEFVCSQTSCNYRTYKEAALKAHERAHLGIKPYRCKWLNCDYSSSYQHDAMKHIRTKHLALLESSNHDAEQFVDPKDYLEVSSELL